MKEPKPKPGCCKEEVWSTGRAMLSVHYCTRKAVKDGYCKIHHPAAVLDRRKKSEEASEKSNPWVKLRKAYDLIREKQDRIAELEAEIERLNQPKRKTVQRTGFPDAFR